jgi:hypothetical protein
MKPFAARRVLLLAAYDAGTGDRDFLARLASHR